MRQNLYTQNTYISGNTSSTREIFRRLMNVCMSVHYVKSIFGNTTSFQIEDGVERRASSKSNLSVRKLAKELGFPATTVHNVLKSFDTHLTTARKAGSGTKTDLRNHQEDAKVKQIL